MIKPSFFYPLAVVLVLSACSSETRSDYLNSRVQEPLKIPADLDKPLSTDNIPGTEANLAEATLKQISPDELEVPPQIADLMSNGSQKSSKRAAYAHMKRDANNTSYLQVDLRFDRAWREVRAALFAAGFSLTDINRDQGLFYIRYRDTVKSGKSKSYVLNLLDVAGSSRLLVRSETGELISSDVTERILLAVRDNLI
ncbi:MAG: outer membrane protein assembly factor BamC [Gammaproteobacteria bacterium]|nr:outer membrane protein assembly factor BamC [Gammaproteobacteria bacterium]